MSIKIAFTVLVTLSLVTPAMAESTRDKSEKKVCKRVALTGTLAGVKKVCRTAKDWQLEREDARKATQEMQNTRLSAPNG